MATLKIRCRVCMGLQPFASICLGCGGTGYTEVKVESAPASDNWRSFLTDEPQIDWGLDSEPADEFGESDPVRCGRSQLRIDPDEIWLDKYPWMCALPACHEGYCEMELPEKESGHERMTQAQYGSFIPCSTSTALVRVQ